jgi:cysteine desulfurase
MNFSFRKHRVYLDYASTTPVSKKVQKAMNPFWSRWFHNPNGLYTSSVKAREWLDEIRSDIASFFGSHSDEIIFTSGGTESDNLALFGVVRAFQKQNPNIKPHLVVSQIEHPAVLESAHFLESTGSVRVDYVEVDEFGVVSLSHLKSLLSKDTILVSVMHVNNELGSLQPIHEITKTVRHFKKHTLSNPYSIYPLVHTDASQSVLYEDVNIQKLGVDLLSCNAGKIYGPKGVGILVKRRNVPLEQMMYGGNQEFGLRPGTVSLPLATGMWAALQEVSETKSWEVERFWLLHDFFVETLRARIPDLQINGKRSQKVPGVVNISYPGIESDLLLLELDVRGFEVSSKTACKYDDPDESYVLQAIHKGKGDEEVGTLRISIGRYTKQKDLASFVDALSAIIRKYQTFAQNLEKKRKIG